MTKLLNTIDSRKTKLESFKEINNSGQRQSIKKRVFKLLEACPKSMRQLATILEVDRTTITRSIKDLENAKLVGVGFVDKCQTSGRRVNFYNVINE